MTEPRASSSGGRLAGPKVAAAAVAVVLALGVVFRFATRSDLWLDEALTVNISRLKLGDIAPWLKHDGAPPLYYWMLHFWTDWFGTSDLAVRALSGVLGVLSLPLAWLCGKRLGARRGANATSANNVHGARVAEEASGGGGGTRLAWVTVVVLALNPFAVRYATENRMYGMESFFVFAGILAVRRALERRTWDRLLVVALLTAALVWTQYWCLSLVAVTGLALLLIAWRSRDALRVNALWTLGAVAVGAATFAGWLPTFIEQSHHTGTPWATPEFPSGPVGQSILEFAGGLHSEGWLLVFVAVVLLGIGTLGHATDHETVELTGHGEGAVIWEAAIGLGGLALGATVAWLGHSGFQPRYAAPVLPMFVLVMARGITVLPTAKLRNATLAFVVLCGFAGSLRNFHENRTQTGQVAAAIEATAKPGDLVVYCPDQLGPATHRILSRTAIGKSLREVAYPLDEPYSHTVTLVDWYDYKKRLAATTPDAAAVRAIHSVQPQHRIFVVTSPGYTTHDALCPPFIDSIVEHSQRHATSLVAADANIFEHAGVYELSPR
ncbi:MAG TPA: glycosyltransferase family 39 protein [Acidimicrobiia bacterium]